MPSRKLIWAISFFVAGQLVTPMIARGQLVPEPEKSLPATQKAVQEPPQSVQWALPPQGEHAFWDRENCELFAAVGAVRAMDYASTRHFRARGANEVLLSNSIVDNKPLFAGIEIGATAASIGVSYLFHRTRHHKLERWVSFVHIGVGAFGDARNYTLSGQPPAP